MKISDALFESFWVNAGPAAYTKKHLWGAMERQAIREYAENLEAAITEDRRPNGPRVTRLQDALAAMLTADIGRVRREDASVNTQGVGSVALTQNGYRDGIVCAMQMKAIAGSANE